MDENKKELAKLRRQASEVASEIHDIVEDTLWSDYPKLSDLAAELIKRCEKVEDFKKERGL
jgi:hypothetical protein